MINPPDPVGTVREGPGLIAVRAYSLSVDRQLGWYIFDLDSGMAPAEVNTVDLNHWPVVYQPRRERHGTH